eukprot:scaffold24089_cov124-Isochrysis_galbana.AAC.2
MVRTMGLRETEALSPRRSLKVRAPLLDSNPQPQATRGALLGLEPPSPFPGPRHAAARSRPCRLCRPCRPYGPALCPTAATWSCPAWSCSTCSSRNTLARPSAPRARWRPSAGCAAPAWRPGGPPDAHAPRVRLGAAAPAGTVAARHRRRAMAELTTARVARKPLAARCPVAGWPSPRARPSRCVGALPSRAQDGALAPSFF